MAEARYERIQTEQDAHAEQEQEEEEEDDVDISLARSAIDITEDPLPYSTKHRPMSIMQAPSAILALIFIYFGLSISLTFYQRGLLKVRIYFEQ